MKKRAESSGHNLREWAREVLLRVDANDKRAEMEMHLFTELVGIEMLMMKTLEPILLGEKLERDQIALLFRQVQSSKAAKAKEILIRRNLKQGP